MKPPTRIRYLRDALLLVLTLALAACAHSQRLSEAQRQEVFQFVWEEVQRSHYDPKLGGVDWSAMRTLYEPKAREAKTDEEFYRVLNQMLGELKQSHFGVIPPGALVAQEEARTRLADGETGLTVQLVEGRPVVVRVRPGSPAARLGVPAGAELLQIDDLETERLLQRIRERNLPPVEERFEASLMFRTYLSGRVGREVRIRYRDLDGKEQTVALPCEAARGERVQLGFIPEIRVHIESRILPGNIGYLAFNAFFPPVMRELPQRLREMANTDGLILDLRENIGGVGLMAGGMMGYLTPRETTLGIMRLRDGTFGIVAYPQPLQYRKPVVVLVDEFSLSTAEIFAAGIQEAKRATIIGRPTPGKALPSKIVQLPYGGYLQCVMADYETARKNRIEGVGVKPDIEVELTREQFRKSADPVLQRAVEHLKQASAQ
ncbi:MAG: peptidase S41 [Fimbriimonadales bacterium]|nr:MAG: peptidase S41 [Fimbriimonadales bacterium]GIV07760.1 MAG: peptidase S41 [Fimbriimonadales bacterium]